MEPGKLFVGGISWDTNEDRLREYFQTFGEVVEAVIMKDRATGRARGFGFVIYADPAVAELVVRQKHMIDGRTVEAKKAVPRDVQHVLNRNQCSPIASPPLARTKKIFVGGLASTVTEGDFKRYFDQFGTITDVVVMYDHNTQRPRGFGFITYDSEEAVDRALFKTFHELNGKMVEVKRAVPKELSPSPNRTALGGGTSGVSRISNFLNGYPQGLGPISIGGPGINIGERPTPMCYPRNGFSSLTSSSFGNAMAFNFEPRMMSPSLNETTHLFPNMSFDQGSSVLHNSNVPRHADFPVREVVSKGGTVSDSSSSWSLWGNNDTTFTGNNASMSFKVSDIESDILKSSEAIRSSPLSVQAEACAPLSNSLNFCYGSKGVNVGSAVRLHERDLRAKKSLVSSFGLLDGISNAKFDECNTGGGGRSWSSAPFSLKGSGSFDFGLGNTGADVPLNNPAGLCW